MKIVQKFSLLKKNICNPFISPSEGTLSASITREPDNQ